MWTLTIISLQYNKNSINNKITKTKISLNNLCIKNMEKLMSLNREKASRN